MKPGEIATRLARSNPWWRDPSWAADDRFLRAANAAPFDYRPQPLDGLREGGLYFLRGPRRVGKSTEVKRAVSGLLDRGVQARRVVHMAVDGWASRELAGLVRAAATYLSPPSDGPRFWFIDEITSVDGDWPAEIKWLRDNDAAFAADTVVLTGSAADRLDDATMALAGRQGPVTDPDRTLLPMSFSAFCGMSGLVDLPMVDVLRPRDLLDRGATVAQELLPWSDDLVTAWEVYLTVGGFPQAVASWVRDREIDPAFVAALWKVVSGDALARRQLSTLQTIELLRLLSTRLCSPLNVSRLARDLDVAKGTVDGSLADLVRSYLLWPAHREQGLGPNLRAQSKYYFSDPLLARLAEYQNDGRAPDPTRLSEQQIGVALLRAVARAEPGVMGRYDQLMYYQNASGAEIDFVGRALGGVAVESKYVDVKWGRELQTIRTSPWTAIVATRAGIEFGDDALVVPAPVLAVMLGG